MFRLQPSPTFKTLVPLSQAGVEQPIEVPFEFRHKPKTALVEWLKRARGRTDADVLHEVIVGWGVVDQDGVQVPYSHTALVTLLENYPAASWEIFGKYESELTKAKEKNS